MSKNARRRTALVGIDGFAPAFMDQFLDAETMPALAALRGRGCECLSCPPFPHARRSRGRR